MAPIIFDDTSRTALRFFNFVSTYHPIDALFCRQVAKKAPSVAKHIDASVLPSSQQLASTYNATTAATAHQVGISSFANARCAIEHPT